MSRETDPCECGAPVRSASNYGTPLAPRFCISWTCGASSNYDGPGNPCPNAKNPEPVETPKAVAVEVIEAVEPETLPAVLTSAQVTERELCRLEAFKGEVLSDPSDAKGAKALNAKRLECRSVRLTAVRICRGEREEAVRIQKEWVAIEKQIEARLDPVEAHLAAEAARHDDWKAEQARIAEAARIARIKGRIEDLVRIGADIDMTEVEALDDVEWVAYIEQTRAAIDAENALRARAAELTEAGDECTTDEIRDLTLDQYNHRREVALKAKAEREELARIKADEEAKAKEAELAKVLEIEAENARLKAEAEQTARELKKMREEKEEAERKRVEAEQAARREAERKELAEKEAAAKVESDRIEAERSAKESEERVQAEMAQREREEALRPERDKIIAWSDAVWKSIPTKPVIEDVNLRNHMIGSEYEIRRVLELLCEAMK